MRMLRADYLMLVKDPERQARQDGSIFSTLATP
jgi:hypothetical protein